MNAKKTLVVSAVMGMLTCPNGNAANNDIDNTSRDSHLMRHRSVPVTIHKGFLVVATGQIGGVAQKQNFVIDTGTAPSILNARVAKELGLTVSVGTLEAAGHEIQTRHAALPELELGPLQVSGLRVNVMDLLRLEKDLGIPVAGLLGMDVLGKASFRLDYERKELSFGAVTREGIPVVCDAVSSLALADVRLQGRHVRLIVDSGSDLVVVYGEGWNEGVARGVNQTGVSVGEQVGLKQIAGGELEVGGKQFHRSRMYYAPTARGTGYDGFMGIRALKLHGVSFDHERQMMYLLN